MVGRVGSGLVIGGMLAFALVASGCRIKHYGYHGAPPPAQAQPPQQEQSAPHPDSEQAHGESAPTSVDDMYEAMPEPPPPAPENNDGADITGMYAVKGTDANGTHYTGSAMISNIKGSMYEGTWKIGSTVWHAIIFRDKNLLSAGTAPKKDLGVMAYLVQGNKLDGLWFEEHHTNTGYEKIVKWGGAGIDLTGTYNIQIGETPDKKKYNGKVFIARYDSGVYNVSWKFTSGLVLKGLGLRSWKLPGTKEDILSVGFNDGGDATVLQFVVQKNGKRLKGHWAQPNGNGAPTWGVETLERL